jgi:hypothetical protein
VDSILRLCNVRARALANHFPREDCGRVKFFNYAILILNVREVHEVAE